MANNYIILSDDALAAYNKALEIKDTLKEDFEYLEYDLEEDNLFELVDELTTVSLFSNPKFIVVKNAEAIIKSNDKAFDDLIKAMNDINSQNALVFITLKSIDPSNEKYNRLVKYSIEISLKIKNIPKDSYILDVCKKNGYEIDNDAVALLISYTDYMYNLKNSLDILLSYKTEEKKITSSDVKKMITPPLDDNIYDLIQFVLEKDKKRCFQAINDLKLHNAKSSYIVSMLINKFQEMYNTSILIKANVSQAELAQIYNVSSGKAYYMMKNAKSYNFELIKKNLALLNELELKIKSGIIDENLGLELFILN